MFRLPILRVQSLPLALLAVFLWVEPAIASGAQHDEKHNDKPAFVYKIGPSIFSAMNSNEYSLGLNFRLGYEKKYKKDTTYNTGTDQQKAQVGNGEEQETASRLRSYYKADLQGGLAIDPDTNPDPIFLEAELGLSFLYGELIELPSTMEEARRLINGEEAFSYFLAGTLGGRVESDQTRDNQLVSFGAHIHAVSDNYSDFVGLLPSLRLSFEVSRDLSSEAARRESAEDETFTRFRASANRVVKLVNYAEDLEDTFLKDTKLIFDLHYYKEFERAEQWNDQGLDEAFYGAFTFSLGNVFKIPHVSDVFLRLSAGRLPPNLEEASTITLGLTFY